MSKRALRRHQQHVARLRHVRIVWRSSSWYWADRPFHVIEEPGWPWVWHRKPWQQVSRCTMSGEPKHWQYDFNIRPSRTRQSHLLRQVLMAVDPEVIVNWPDYRKPHIYYW